MSRDTEKTMEDLEDKLLETEERLRYLEYILAIMPGNVYWKLTNGKYQFCNINAANTVGLRDHKDVEGKRLHEFVDKKYADVIETLDQQVMESGEEKVFEENAFSADGTPAVYLTRKTPLRDKDGNVSGMMGVSLDITERKKMEEELKLASAIKSQFVQNIEHDLRTPATGVYGMLEILARKETDKKQKRILEMLAKSSKQLVNLLDEITAFDQISSGKLPVLNQRFDLSEVLNAISDMENPAVKQKGLKFTLEVAKDVPQFIISDRHRIFRILLNIIGNAIKFTKAGYVKISVNVAKKVSAKQLILRFVVEDTGIGIPDDKKKRVYNSFERCIPANVGRYEGTGLGLCITKQFIDDIYGEIEFQSTEGEGTTFTCLIPCSLALMDLTNYAGVFLSTKKKKSKKPKA